MTINQRSGVSREFTLAVHVAPSILPPKIWSVFLLARPEVLSLRVRIKGGSRSVLKKRRWHLSELSIAAQERVSCYYKIDCIKSKGRICSDNTWLHKAPIMNSISISFWLQLKLVFNIISISLKKKLDKRALELIHATKKKR